MGEWSIYFATKAAGVLVCIFFGGRAVSRALGISKTRAILINSIAAFVAFCSSRVWYILQNDMDLLVHGQSLAQSWDEAGSCRRLLGPLTLMQ